MQMLEEQGRNLRLTIGAEEELDDTKAILIEEKDSDEDSNFAMDMEQTRQISRKISILATPRRRPLSMSSAFSAARDKKLKPVKTSQFSY